jgi:septum formation protein
MRKVIRASGSPRRKMLLEWAEVDFEVVVSDADESFSSSLMPAEVAVSIAKKKNQAVVDLLQTKLTDTIIISADTIVVLENEIIGKPVDKNDAIAIIQKLSGKNLT